jgi:hypothetical protein
MGTEGEFSDSEGDGEEGPGGVVGCKMGASSPISTIWLDKDLGGSTEGGCSRVYIEVKERGVINAAGGGLGKERKNRGEKFNMMRNFDLTS